MHDGWDVFDQTTRYLTDRMPLREQAVRANTRISRDLFDTTPRYGAAGSGRGLPFAAAGQGPARPKAVKGREASRVVQGSDGWLYLGEERQRACTPVYPRDAAQRRWRQLVDIVRDSGRRAVLVVPPDKSTIYPEHLPDDPAAERCARKGGEEFWRLLASAPASAGLIGLREPVRRLKRASRERIYLKTDTHWTHRAGLELVRGVLGQIGGGVRLRPGDVRSGGRPALRGDLNGLLGEGATERRELLKIERRGGRRVPGRTVFVLDSYGDAVGHLLEPYFERFEKVFWITTEPIPPATLAAKIRGADTVIFETVEREFGFRASEQGPVNTAFMRRLRAGLSKR